MNTSYTTDGRKNKKTAYTSGKNEFAGNDKGFKGRGDGKKEFRSHFNAKPSGNKNYKPRSNNYSYMNKEEEDAPRREFRSKSTKDTKPKEPQQEKIDIKNRLEKEKKVMQKKQENKKAAVKHKPQARPKRSNNIDWTREYENDSYDDDYLDSYL